MQRSEMLDYLQDTIATFDKEIERLRENRNSIIEIRDMLKEVPKPALKRRWVVPSRTGGANHDVIYDPSLRTWECDCKAGERGVLCWAVKGLKSGQAQSHDYQTFHISDENSASYRVLRMSDVR